MLSRSAATLVNVAVYALSQEARNKYNAELLANPGNKVQALANWIKGLLQSSSLAIAVDACNEVITQLCKWASYALSGPLGTGGVAG